MKRFEGSPSFPSDLEAPIVTMGNFDGVHRGHIHLLEKTKAMAAASHGTSLVYTFEPHPACVLAPHAAPCFIQTLEQKMMSLEMQHIDVCVIEPFTKKFAELTPEVFFQRVLVERLRARAIVVGYDFTFGVHRSGTARNLETLCKKANIELVVVPAQFEGETLISSSQIRKLIELGDVARARKLLGRPYEMWGKVTSGRGVGRDLGARTANLESANKLLPRDGVYLTLTTTTRDKKSYASITNVGTRPTFFDAGYAIETHLLDVTMGLSEAFISIAFLERMRDEIRFDDPKKLKIQIAQDLENARQKHASREHS